METEKSCNWSEYHVDLPWEKGSGTSCASPYTHLLIFPKNSNENRNLLNIWSKFGNNLLLNSVPRYWSKSSQGIHNFQILTNPFIYNICHNLEFYMTKKQNMDQNRTRISEKNAKKSESDVIMTYSTYDFWIFIIFRALLRTDSNRIYCCLLYFVLL